MEEKRWRPRKGYHYLYLVQNEHTGLFYVGVRSSYQKPEFDHYWGSGALLWDVYNLQGYYSLKQGIPRGWKKYVVEQFSDRIAANKYELQAIKAVIDDPYCLNCRASKRVRLNQLTAK
jgi:predicted GIY-YIG superfamily endonuclease